MGAMDREGNNWLRPSVITCPDCGIHLFRVDRSPFDDHYRLYCDRCPKQAEISFYDAGMNAIRDAIVKQNRNIDHSSLMQGIESRLNRCVCGGSFRAGAARRCYHCKAEVVTDSGVDVSIYTGCEDQQDRDPTPEEMTAYETWLAEYVRTSDLWSEL